MALGALPAGVLDAEVEGGFADYSQSVADAGGLPVLLPRSADPQRIVERIDALVLVGGEDVEPHRYGAQVGPHATSFDRGRDDFELALIDAAIERGLPVLAICRGAQVLNVARGGTLVEHLDPTAELDHSTTDAPRSERRHRVTIAPDSLVAQALTPDLDADGGLAVNSYHHQAVDRPGDGLRIVARADDGTVEAVEDRDRRLVGVQWHPEMHDGVDPLFTWFIQQALDAP